MVRSVLVVLLLCALAVSLTTAASPVRSHARSQVHTKPLHIDVRPVSSLSPNTPEPITPAHARALQATNCTLGVDLATPSSLSSFQCMVDAGIQFAVVRAFQSNCWLDPHAVDTIRAAWSAGLVVDIYFFPSTGCVLDQAGQVDAALVHLTENNVQFNRLWIDVEAWQWWDDCALNIAWLTPLLEHAQSKLGVGRVGFYAGKNFFTQYFCNTTLYSEQYGVKLWYARWDHNPSFFNFSSYGGWEVGTNVFMKQYNAEGMCDVHTDSDWRGSGDCGNHLREAWEKEQQQRVPDIAPPRAPSSHHDRPQRGSLRVHDPRSHRHVPSFMPTGSPNCTIGVDLATPTSADAFRCMAQQGGVQYAVIRAAQSNCYLDPHVVDSLHNVAQAGLQADVYVFPSVGCTTSAVQQIDATLDHLEKNQAVFNTLWLDVEDWGWAPIAECQSNLEWFRPMVARAVSRLGANRVGIYSMATMWNRIACNTTEFADQGLRLWWAHWSGGQSFADYVPFGGWEHGPSDKQWQDWGVGCGVDVDADWRPSGDCGAASKEERLRQEEQREIERAYYLKASANAAKGVVAAPVSSPAPAASPNCTIGVDLATPVSVSAFQCLRETRGVQFLTVRAFQSNCYIDPHTVDTIHAAWDAGLSGVDIYFFPSTGCAMEGVIQFDATMAHLKANNATFGTVWFDVEDWEWLPESQCQENIDWFMPLFQHAQSVLGVDRVGIYTVTGMWKRITCNSTLFQSAKLWYASWNGQPNYDGYTPFGGWQPTMKQYTGNDQACDIHLDMDVRMDGKC